MSNSLVAEKREIRGLYLAAWAHGPLASLLVIFIQLLVVKQTKYLAAENGEGETWIEWREKFADGDLCNGTGRPLPKNSPEPYSRPEGYSEDCVWFPTDKTLPGLGVEYTNAITYGTAIILFLSGDAQIGRRNGLIDYRCVAFDCGTLQRLRKVPKTFSYRKHCNLDSDVLFGVPG